MKPIKRIVSKFTLPAILALASLSFASNASAAASMTIADSANHIVKVDATGLVTYSGLCTSTTCPGFGVALTAGSSFGFVGTIGDFSVAAYGQPRATLPTGLDLNLNATSLLGGTLTATLTDTGYALMAPWTTTDIPSFTGPGTMKRVAYADTSNTPYGTSSIVDSTGPDAVGYGIHNPLSGPSGLALSMTAQLVFQMSPAADFSDDFGFFGSPAPLSVACPGATAQAGTMYNSSLVATGGTVPYVYSIIGALPAGLTLNPLTGAISGAPSTVGTYNFSAQVVDSSGASNGSQRAVSPCGITVAIAGSIGNRVWTDTNANGVQDTGEVGIVGMAITLSKSTGIVGTTTTGTDGAYGFAGLAAGTYTVCASPSTSLTETFDLDGVTSKDCATVTLTSGQARTDVDFGYVTTGSNTGSNICGLSPGYWKNHSIWPASTLVLGTQTYTKTELLSLLNAPKKGDSTLILAFQLIAAKLNVLNGTTASTAGNNITQADQLLSAYGHLPLAKGVSSSQMTTVGTALSRFNNDGELQPYCTMPK